MDKAILKGLVNFESTKCFMTAFSMLSCYQTWVFPNFIPWEMSIT